MGKHGEEGSAMLGRRGPTRFERTDKLVRGLLDRSHVGGRNEGGEKGDGTIARAGGSGASARCKLRKKLEEKSGGRVGVSGSQGRSSRQDSLRLAQKLLLQSGLDCLFEIFGLYEAGDEAVEGVLCGQR
jgi:hypothetical protein